MRYSTQCNNSLSNEPIFGQNFRGKWKSKFFCTLENLDNNYKCTRKKEISPFAIIGSESMTTSDSKHDKNFAKALEDSFKAMVKIHSSLFGVHTTNASLASLTGCNGSLNILQFVFLLLICHFSWIISRIIIIC